MIVNFVGFHILLVGYFSHWAFAYHSDVDYDGILSIRLQHALDHVPNPSFADRGKINIQSIRTEDVALQQSVLSVTDRRKLKELAKVDGLYRLRSYVQTKDGKESSFLTFVKACSLLESRLSDMLTVAFDQTGSVIAVSMSTLPIVCKGLFVHDEDLKYFNTTISFRHMEQGPIPDTATYIQKLEKEREARERGETKDNRSFLAKYWMYIVPVVIFVVLSGAANPEGAAGGGGGGR